MIVSGTFSAAGVSDLLYQRVGGTLTYALSVAAEQTFNGIVRLEKSTDLVTWTPARDVDDVLLVFDGTVVPLAGAVAAGTTRQGGAKPAFYRWRCLDAGDEDAIAYQAVDVAGDRLTVLLRDGNGTPVLFRTDDGLEWSALGPIPNVVRQIVLEITAAQAIAAVDAASGIVALLPEYEDCAYLVAEVLFSYLPGTVAFDAEQQMVFQDAIDSAGTPFSLAASAVEGLAETHVVKAYAPTGFAILPNRPVKVWFDTGFTQGDGHFQVTLLLARWVLP